MSNHRSTPESDAAEVVREEGAFTRGPWSIAMMNDTPDMVERVAALRAAGEDVSRFEPRPFRENSGAFIIMAGAGQYDKQRIGTADLIGNFKRSQRYDADDPIALANARLIAAAPDLYSAGQRLEKASRRLYANISEFGRITDDVFLDDLYNAGTEMIAALSRAANPHGDGE
jgi:hypothetical protein